GVRQHQVENDGVHRLAPMQRQAARPVLGMNDMEARLAEIFRDHAGKAGIVFDQEDAFTHENGSRASTTHVRHWYRTLYRTTIPINRDASVPRGRRRMPPASPRL